MRIRSDVTWFLDEALDMLDRADRLQRQFFHLPASGRQGPSWAPPVDVFKQGDRLVILVALPGVAPERVEVRQDGTGIVISGERPLPAACREAEIIRLEIPYGRFERRIELSREPCGAAQPVFVDGCLMITLDMSPRGEQS
ncbi:MAG: Hsp20/alpha crystallin family protein [Zoogloeaceae bacterium]|nr:Hsp20/alpha crystallin family protein [Rhodocyclaceae bacterium]MCP5240295.1 Hsp20/alpha crystallin family protein [Zoogloeaceae bacterium]MCP5253596.1 Hsp20/alpha crystallin family protein [Zoogloeaceae bacterium]MCP5295055.1 Hsp20/alpha crystallin family protein [Zoogloeaceae bacterium]MCW5616922.1 Hsp20/alpha crystallin family protein [Rhodocyclaceae bacterium]